jgi:hypothetical protein
MLLSLLGIRARQNMLGGWVAEYCDRDGYWCIASDARGVAINCATEDLALSVARYRRQRLKVWN